MDFEGGWGKCSTVLRLHWQYLLQRGYLDIHIVKGMSPRPGQFFILYFFLIWTYQTDHLPEAVWLICQSNVILFTFLIRIQSEAQEPNCLSACKWRSCIKVLCYLFKWCCDYYFSEVLIRKIVFLWFIVQADSTRKNIKGSKDLFKPVIGVMKSVIISCIQSSFLC